MEGMEATRKTLYAIICISIMVGFYWGCVWFVDTIGTGHAFAFIGGFFAGMGLCHIYAKYVGPIV